MERKFPRKIKRVVIKVGSSLLADEKMRPREASLKSLVAQICALKDKGIKVLSLFRGKGFFSGLLCLLIFFLLMKICERLSCFSLCLLSYRQMRNGWILLGETIKS